MNKGIEGSDGFELYAQRSQRLLNFHQNNCVYVQKSLESHHHKRKRVMFKLQKLNNYCRTIFSQIVLRKLLQINGFFVTNINEQTL